MSSELVHSTLVSMVRAFATILGTAQVAIPKLAVKIQLDTIQRAGGGGLDQKGDRHFKQTMSKT